MGWLDTVAVMYFTLRLSPMRVRLAVIICLILATGCGPQQTVKAVKPTPKPTAVAEARLRDGDFLGAAAEFARLSHNGDSATVSRYRMMAALAYLDGEDPISARTLLSEPPDDASVRQLYALALAAADALEPTSDQAVQQIESVDSRTLAPYPRGVYYRTLGRIALHNRSFQAAASAFIAADAQPLPTTKRAKLHSDIWLALSHVDATAIKAARGTALRRETGWLDLVIATRSSLYNSAALAAAVDAWQIDHAQHPANISLVEQLLELAEGLSEQPRHIAILLPFRGPYANAASVIRDGFLSAWYGDPRTTKPTISIYSVNPSSVNVVYDRAVSAGADFIVGPLEKTTVDILAARRELPVRTLALNFANYAGNTKSATAPIGMARFFQFGLTPEDEAAQVAAKAWADGHSRAVAMGPGTPWGDRLVAAFAQRWQELGGVLLTQVAYGSDDSSYSRSVKQALNIDLSEARAAALRRALNRRIEFEPRRRADIEVIFVAGFPLNARQLLPQL
ncbi:MAG: hypothetical protein E2O35_04265, partial [Proteobacteria bacterium]